MKIWKMIAIFLVIVLAVGVTACNPFAAKTDTTPRFEAVIGNIIVKVNGNGKTGVAEEAKLNFGIAGKIEEMNAEKGDVVKKGQVLARLQTDGLQLAVAQAKTALSQVEIAQTQTEVAYTQAKVALEAAKYDLDRMEDVDEAKDKVTEAERRKQFTEANLQASFAFNDSNVTSFLLREVGLAEIDILNAKKELADLLEKDRYTTLKVDDVALKVAQVDAAEQSLTQAEKTMKHASVSVESAQKSLEYAQKQLEEATIICPIDGLVITVNGREGDYVAGASSASNPVFYIIDPASIEVNAEIDEVDIPNVKLDQKALVSMDASPDKAFEGKVTYISMVPIQKQAGVVAYEVKIKAVTKPEIELRVGMSTSVDIVVNESQNVLMVPNKAIKRDELKTAYVEIVNGEKTEKLPVTLGVSDGTNTEILSGIKEGDMLLARQDSTKKS